MTAKEYLQQIEAKNARIKNLQRDKAALRGLLFSISNSGSDVERVQTSHDHDKMGTIYSKIDEKERKINEMIDSLLDFRLKVTAEINELEDGRYIDVLYRKYVLNQSWKEISTEMRYSIRHVQKINGKALLAFQRLHADKLQ